MQQCRILFVTAGDPAPLDVAPLGIHAQIIPSQDFDSALKSFKDCDFNAILINTCADFTNNSIEFVQQVRNFTRSLPCILVTSWSSEEIAVNALNAGVSLYLRHPLNGVALSNALLSTLPRCAVSSGAPSDRVLAGADRLIGHGPAVTNLRHYILKVARCQSNVLITGETGTGKELIAELIHLNSPRHLRPLVCLNATAIPDSLLESELFGYERGAFTGAHARQQGKLALANTGTVFFDEIGDISSSVQAKLLRALDGKAVYRLGGDREVPLDVRILAATNQDLEEAVDQNRFRRDLYYRLNVVRIQIPPLRERPEDIPALIDHYMAHFNGRFGMHVEGFTADAVAQMVSYAWPGNIRELKNVLEVVFVNLPGRRVSAHDLPSCITNYLAGRTKTAERDALLNALVATNWNKTKAAEQLRWSRMTLYRKMSTYKVVDVRVSNRQNPTCERPQTFKKAAS